MTLAGNVDIVDAQAGELTRLDRISRVQQVSQQLRSSILAGRIGADGVLPSEGELAQLLGVSRTVVREAMRSLQAQGLVEKSQGRRARLKPAGAQAVAESLEVMLSRTDLSLVHLLEVRRALEAEIAALAAERATEAQIRGLYEAIQHQRDARSLHESAQADILFHRRLVAMTGNRLFELFLVSVSDLLHETVWRTLPESGPEPAIDGHIRIANAISGRDPEGARRAMIEHMDWTENEVEPKPSPQEATG